MLLLCIGLAWHVEHNKNNTTIEILYILNLMSETKIVTYNRYSIHNEIFLILNHPDEFTNNPLWAHFPLGFPYNLLKINTVQVQ